MVRAGAERAHPSGRDPGGRATAGDRGRALPIGTSRAFVNRHRVHRRGDLHEALRTTVFSPEAVSVVRSGRPPNADGSSTRPSRSSTRRMARTAEDVERILRQRAALLRSSGRRLTPEVASTLDVWDARLAAAGTPWSTPGSLAESGAPGRGPLLRGWPESSPPRSGSSTSARGPGPSQPPSSRPAPRTWPAGVSTVGPHRDELELTLRRDAGAGPTPPKGNNAHWPWPSGSPAHQLATERLGTPPVLLLDDVFSELDRPGHGRPWSGSPRADHVTTAFRSPPEVHVAKIYTLVGRRSRRLPRRGPRSDRGRERDSGPRPLGASFDVLSKRLGSTAHAASAACSPAGPRSSARPWPSTSGRSGSTPTALVVDRRPPGVGHPAPAPRGHLLDTVTEASGRRPPEPARGARESLTGPPAERPNRPGGQRAATLEHRNLEITAAPEVRTAQPDRDRCARFPLVQTTVKGRACGAESGERAGAWRTTRTALMTSPSSKVSTRSASARDVHRIHRPDRSAPPGVGGRRQLGGRGDGRALHPDRRHPAGRRRGQGVRQRPGDPRRGRWPSRRGSRRPKWS